MHNEKMGLLFPRSSSEKLPEDLDDQNSRLYTGEYSHLN